MDFNPAINSFDRFRCFSTTADNSKELSAFFVSSAHFGLPGLSVRVSLDPPVPSWNPPPDLSCASHLVLPGAACPSCRGLVGSFIWGVKLFWEAHDLNFSGEYFEDRIISQGGLCAYNMISGISFRLHLHTERCQFVYFLYNFSGVF